MTILNSFDYFLLLINNVVSAAMKHEQGADELRRVTVDYSHMESGWELIRIQWSHYQYYLLMLMAFSRTPSPSSISKTFVPIHYMLWGQMFVHVGALIRVGSLLGKGTVSHWHCYNSMRHGLASPDPEHHWSCVTHHPHRWLTSRPL